MKVVKLVRQHDEKDCGAACLSMILEYFGRKVSLSSIRQAIKVDRNGANIYGIMDGAKQYHVNSQAFEGTADDAWLEISANEYSFPFIARIINDNIYEHYVVVSGMKGNKLVLMDPAKGRRILDKEEFSECFLGHVITFVPGEGFKKKNDRFSNYKRYFLMISKQKGLLITTAGLSLLIMGIGIAGMYLFRYIIDSVLSRLNVKEITEGSLQ